MKLILLVMLTMSLSLSFAKTLLATGTIESENTQHVLMPLVESFNGKVNEIIAEGAAVKIGDLIAKVDGASVDAKIESLKEQLESFSEKAKKSEIDSKITLSNTRISFEKAETTLKIAKMKADLPLNFIGELKYKQNQLSFKQAGKLLQKAKNDLIEAKQKKKETQNESVLGFKQRLNKLNTQQELLKSLSIYALQEGYTVYSQHPWTGKKIQAGDQLQTGMEILTVSQNKNLKIVAWVNAIDIPNIRLGQKVSLSFDAYLSHKYEGKIILISQGGEEKKSWGDGLYYRVEVEIVQNPQINLLIGMSALIEIEEQIND